MKFWNFYQEEPEEPEETEETEETERPGEPEDIRPVDIIDISGEIIAGEDWARVGGACYATDFRRALDGVGDVTVRINSPGGDVLAGAEIYSALREHSLNGKGRVRVEIMALAASAASVIAMAGDKIYMYPTAYMMIHNPWTGAVGDAREMRKAAKTLDEIARGLINAYKIKTGKTEDQLKKMLDAETWMSAGTCVMEGFADGVIGANDAGQRAAAMAGNLESRVMMAARSHGLQDILAMYKAEETEEETEEEPTAPEEEPADPDEEEPETEETEPDGSARAPRADAGLAHRAREDARAEDDPEEEPDETDARAEEDPEEEPADPDEEEPETEETEPEAMAEEEPADPDEETEPEEEPEQTDGSARAPRADAGLAHRAREDAEDMARTEARALLMDEILAVRILMSQEM